MAVLRYIALFEAAGGETARGARDADKPRGELPTSNSQLTREQAGDGSLQGRLPFAPAEDWMLLAESLTPRFEVHPRGLILEVTPRDESKVWRRLRQEIGQEGLLSAASTRTAARLAACCGLARRIPPGQERDVLAELPIQSLAFLREDFVASGAADTFARWGVRTLGELARLPRDELAARLGKAGVHLRRLARGIDEDPFQAHRAEAPLEESRELDWTLDSLEPLTFLLGGMLDRLCLRLQERGLAADELIVQLLLEDNPGGELPTRNSQLTTGPDQDTGCADTPVRIPPIFESRLRLPFPMRIPKVLLSLLRLDLQARPPQAGIRAVTLRIEPTHPRTLQYSLLQASLPDPEKLSRTMARLSALVGEENLGRPEPLDSHRPDAFRLRPLLIGESRRRRSGASKRKASERLIESEMVVESQRRRTLAASAEARLVLRRLRPPRPIQLSRDQIAAAAGPWRSSGDWWKEQESAKGEDSKSAKREVRTSHFPGFWGRDEWDVELTDGILCRIFWDHGRGGWFLEGVYD